MRGWVMGFLIATTMGCAEMDEFVYNMDAYHPNAEVYQGAPGSPGSAPPQSPPPPRITNQSNEPELLK